MYGRTVCNRSSASVLSLAFNGYHGNSHHPTLATIEASEREGTVPSQTRVVICGGGIIGASVAYHLAELGWGKDTVVIEKGR